MSTQTATNSLSSDYLAIIAIFYVRSQVVHNHIDRPGPERRVLRSGPDIIYNWASSPVSPSLTNKRRLIVSAVAHSQEQSLRLGEETGNPSHPLEEDITSPPEEGVETDTRPASKRRRLNDDNRTTDAAQMHPNSIAHDANGPRPPSNKGGLGAVSPNQHHSTSPHAANGTNGTVQSQRTSKETSKLTSTYYGHDREEVTRMLIQTLYDLGYPSAADELVGCSGYKLESPAVSSLKGAIIDGRWKDAERLVKQAVNASIEDGASNENAPKTTLLLSPGTNKTEMLFFIRRQRFLEELEKRQLHNALVILQKKLTPLDPGSEELHHLSK